MTTEEAVKFLRGCGPTCSPRELSKAIGKGITAQFSKKISGGFTIGPKDGSYFISLTDETFKSLIGEYLKADTKKLLFG